MERGALWAYNRPKNIDQVLFLSKNDIDHRYRIYRKYQIDPESLTQVEIRYLCDRETLMRYIIKESDVLLERQGTLLIQCTTNHSHGSYIRSISQIKHEVSVATDGRYKLCAETSFENTTTLKYIKDASTNPEYDQIGRWSFGIITNGKNNDKIKALVKSLHALKIPTYEILICGPFDLTREEQFERVKPVADVKIVDDIRAPISQKKNNIVAAAMYNNLCLMHDRYLFPRNWYEKMCEYGNFFDILSMPNMSPNNKRVFDWGQFKGRPSEVTRNWLYLLNYQKWSPHWYAQGGLLIVKKHLYQKTHLDPNLHHLELEDIQFSQVAQLRGLMFHFDLKNTIITYPMRLAETEHFISPIRNSLVYIVHLVSCWKRLWQHKRNIWFSTRT
jgi:hypothetical protein